MRQTGRRVKDAVSTLAGVLKDSELILVPEGTMQSIEWYKVLAISGKAAGKRSKSAGYKIEDITYIVFETIEDLLFEHFEGPEDEFIGLEWFEPAEALGLPLDFSLDDYEDLDSRAKKRESILKFLIQEVAGKKANIRPIEKVTTYKKAKKYERATKEIERKERQLRVQSERRPTKYISDRPEELKQSLEFLDDQGDSEEVVDFQQYRGAEEREIPTQTFAQDTYEYPQEGLAELLDIPEEEVEELDYLPPEVPAYAPSEILEDEEPTEEELLALEEEPDEFWEEDEEDFDLQPSRTQLERVAGLRGWTGARQGRGIPCSVNMRRGSWVNVWDDNGEKRLMMTSSEPYEEDGEWWVDIRIARGESAAYPLENCELATFI